MSHVTLWDHPPEPGASRRHKSKAEVNAMLSNPLELINIAEADLTFEAVAARLSSYSRDELLSRVYDSLSSCVEWRRIVEGSPDGIFLADAHGRGIYVNEAYKIISGLTQDEIENKGPADMIGAGYIDKSCIMVVQRRKAPATIESYFYRTGKKCLVTCKPVLDGEGNIAFLIGSIRDMTEINRLREARSTDRALIEKYKNEVDNLKKQLFQGGGFIVEDPAMLKVVQSAKRISAVDSSVLITGETGVGKEEIARYIHENSPRKNHPFLKINCSTIAESLFESELFGYERGAFTGAKSEGKPGLFELANHGTLFLDEVGELPPAMQAKLLLVLQDKEIMRVGGVRPIQVDVRILSATNRDLARMMDEKAFRADLFYRLNVVPIHVPPLRERPADILPLVEYFLRVINEKYNFHKTFSEGVLATLQECSWPGNIRELRNIVERAIIFSEEDEIGLPEFEAMQFKGADPSSSQVVNLAERLGKIEYDYMRRAYQKHGSMQQAAAALGMKKSTFAGKLKAYQEKYEDTASRP